MKNFMTKTAMVASILALSLSAAAQTDSSAFPGERLRPTVDRDGIIDTEVGSVASHLNYDVGLWFWYARNPLILYTFDDGSANERQQFLLQNRVNASLTGQIALFDFMQIGLELPFIAFQSRPDGDPSKEGFNLVSGDLGSTGFGDLRIVPKFNVLNEEDFFLDLAIIPGFTLPTAGLINKNVGLTEDVDFMGEDFLTFVPELALSKNFGSLRVASNLGYRMRSAVNLQDLDVNGEFVYSVATAYRFHKAFDVPLELGASLSGQTVIGILQDTFTSPYENINRNPLELLGQVKYDLFGNRMQAFVGGGLGLIAGYGTPDFRVFGGLNYSPRSGDDRDKDGILDSDDQCPDDPEDKDGFEDSNGCPDPDNDNDGVLDVDDRCPMEPEDVDTFEDTDGCPDPDNDKDGVLDVDDRCPLEPGTAENAGCAVNDRDCDGIPDDKDACPDEPEDRDNFEDEDGCADPDNDKDGILDANDKCPIQPEDKDGFEDEDGCPDVDNDKDGFKDADDKCPNEPETVNGNKDDDGCPDKGKTKVKFTGKSIVILEKVYFDTAKAKIKARSFNLLQQVATIMKTHPEVTKLSIEGHTDAQGSDKYNLDLSDRRSKAVRTFLISRGGIAPERLDAKGFGEGSPIATNDTKSGREQNRRVEFNIVEMNGKAVSSTKSIETAQ